MKRIEVLDLSSTSENKTHQNHLTRNIQTQPNHPKIFREENNHKQNCKNFFKGGIKAYLDALKQDAPDFYSWDRCTWYAKVRCHRRST